MKKITIGKIAYKNLVQKPFRLIGLIFLAAAVTFTVFGSFMAAFGLTRGTKSLSGRMGADLMAVPLGYEKEAQGILLRGEPNYFYMDQSILEKIKNTEGVEKATVQFYMASSGQDCCDIPVQFIGFEPETDFVVTPWIQQVYDHEVKDGTIIVGSDIEVPQNKQLIFYGKSYQAAAKLDKTGTGTDQSIFANMDTIKSLLEAAKQEGFTFVDSVDPEHSISNIMIRVKEGYAIDEVKHNIRIAADGLQVIGTTDMLKSIEKGIRQFYLFMKMAIISLLVICMAALTAMFCVSANERRKEFAIMRMLGAKKTSLAGILANEALLVSVSGGTAGVILGLLAFIPFCTSISNAIGMPYLLPDILQTAGIIILSMAVSMIFGPLSACVSILRICKSQTYFVLREGE